MKTVKTLIIMTVLLLFSTGAVWASQHFSSVENTGVTCAIVIQEATINNATLEIGDEIAVFDDDLCVGVAVYEGSFPVSCSGILEYVPPSGPTLVGARHGYPIIFKLWKNSTDLEYEATATFTDGGHFGDILTVVNPLSSTTSGVETGEETGLQQFQLHPNAPNPFNPETQISFTLPKQAKTRLSIYNTRGQLVRTLAQETIQAGRHTLTWNGKNNRALPVPSGTYILKIDAGEFTKTQKLVLIK